MKLVPHSLLPGSITILVTLYMCTHTCTVDNWHCYADDVNYSSVSYHNDHPTYFFASVPVKNCLRPLETALSIITG